MRDDTICHLFVNIVPSSVAYIYFPFLSFPFFPFPFPLLFFVISNHRFPLSPFDSIITVMSSDDDVEDDDIVTLSTNVTEIIIL